MKLIDLRDVPAAEAVGVQLPRPALDTTGAVAIVRPLLQRVIDEGAPALYQLAEKFDHVTPPSLAVGADELRAAYEGLDPQVREALELAIEHARAAHQAQLPTPKITEVVPGGVVAQRWVPLRRAGLYVPGGRAVYPSSVVMNVVPAQVAGVESIVVASPPQADFGGLPHPTILAACHMLGVTEVIAVGGAQAIGAMAYGFTDGDYTCKPVDKVAGPGNIYVAAAKRCVQEVCGIDAEAGTTEIGILADSTADPSFIAADLISQAEHDPAAASVLVTDSMELAAGVLESIDVQVENTLHRERILEALGGPQSGIIVTANLDVAEAIIEAYGAEHLEIMTADATERAMRIRNAGAIFVGPFSPVPLGDYMAGSNHVLPTGGTARYASGLNVTQYLRSVQVIDYSEGALASVAAPLVALAEAEELPAHGQAVSIRGGRLKTEDSPVRLPWRPELADVEPYGAPQLDVPVRLNVNENPYAPQDAVVDSVVASVRDAMANLNRYADRDAWGLREALAEYLRAESGADITAAQVWAANGSNEVMLQLLQAFGGPGRTVMASAPTYSMYVEYARDTNSDWVCLPAPQINPDDAGSLFAPLDVDRFIRGMKQYRPAVVLLPSPNNPSGTAIPAADLELVLAAAKTTGPGGAATVVVVDEAYGEFRAAGTPSAIELLADNPHLVVTRTLSKAFAAAGLRLGYMVAATDVIDEVQKVRLPYHLSLLTQAAATAALSHAETQMEQVDLLRQERDALSQWLQDQGLQVAPSSANFLLFGPVEDREQVWQQLVDRGVLIRVVGPEGCLRVTVGTPEENAAFRQALVEVLA